VQIRVFAEREQRRRSFVVGAPELDLEAVRGPGSWFPFFFSPADLCTRHGAATVLVGGKNIWRDTRVCGDRPTEATERGE
jgi:hypothetical protein